MHFGAPLFAFSALLLAANCPLGHLSHARADEPGFDAEALEETLATILEESKAAFHEARQAVDTYRAPEAQEALAKVRAANRDYATLQETLRKTVDGAPGTDAHEAYLTAKREMNSGYARLTAAEAELAQVNTGARTVITVTEQSMRENIFDLRTNPLFKESPIPEPVKLMVLFERAYTAIFTVRSTRSVGELKEAFEGQKGLIESFLSWMGKSAAEDASTPWRSDLKRVLTDELTERLAREELHAETDRAADYAYRKEAVQTVNWKAPRVGRPIVRESWEELEAETRSAKQVETLQGMTEVISDHVLAAILGDGVTPQMLNRARVMGAEGVASKDIPGFRFGDQHALDEWP